MKTTTVSSKCPKCGGSGKLDWTSNDGGICYKCEGNGYLGDMPEGFNKMERQAKEAAKGMVENAVLSLNMKGEFICVRSYEFYPQTIKTLIEKGKTFRYKYTKFWMDCPDMTVDFGGDNEYKYRLTVGGEFLTIQPIKL